MSEQPTSAAPGTEPKQYTPEELKAMRNQAREFYKEELSVLRLRAEYERLHAEIEESKLNKIIAIQKQAYLYAQMEEAGKEDRQSKEEKKEESQEDLQEKLKEDGLRQEPRKLKIKQDDLQGRQ